jgi:hypothetical protein
MQNEEVGDRASSNLHFAFFILHFSLFPAPSADPPSTR